MSKNDKHDHDHDADCDCLEETIVELTDEDGNVALFREEEVIDVDGEHYAVLVPTVADDKVPDTYRDEDEDTACFMKVVADENGDEVYTELTDAEFEAACKAYDALYDDDDEKA